MQITSCLVYRIGFPTSRPTVALVSCVPRSHTMQTRQAMEHLSCLAELLGGSKRSILIVQGNKCCVLSKLTCFVFLLLSVFPKSNAAG